MDNRLHCFNKLEELFSLYDKVRQSVILLENFNEEQKMYIAPINQLRSALDHIFKAINICDDFEQCEYELREAKEHLDRAGYDTMELLAANIGITIVEKLKRYDTKTITEVFPYYFTTIKPQLTDIKVEYEEMKEDYDNQVLVLKQKVTELNNKQRQLVKNCEDKVNEMKNECLKQIEDNDLLTNNKIMEMTRIKDLAVSELDAIRIQQGKLTPSLDYTSRERFLEIEAEFEVFKKFYNEQWKLTKKQIRQEILWKKQEAKQAKNKRPRFMYGLCLFGRLY